MSLNTVNGYLYCDRVEGGFGEESYFVVIGGGDAEFPEGTKIGAVDVRPLANGKYLIHKNNVYGRYEFTEI